MCKTPHKHAELIKAWADGAAIQYYCRLNECWISCVNNQPEWNPDKEYRIKPEPSDLEKYGVEVGDVWALLKGGYITIACPNVGVSSICSIFGVMHGKEQLKTLMFRRGVVNKLWIKSLARN